MLALLIIVAALQTEAAGRRIVVKDGDTIILNAGVNGRIVRSRTGDVRLALGADGKELVMLIDESTGAGPDGLVDQAYRFQLQQSFPVDNLWRGAATIEETDKIVEGRIQRSAGPTLITPAGRIHFGAPADDDTMSGMVVRAHASQMRQLTQHYRGSRLFDDVEQIWLNHLEDTVSEVRAHLDMSARPSVSGPVVSTQTTTAVTAAVSAPADSVPRADELRGTPGFTLPRVMRDVKPQYTADAMRRGVEGLVSVDAIVGADGTVSNTTVVRALDPDLDKAALAAVRQWRFVPAMRDGVAVPVMVTIELTFTLKR